MRQASILMVAGIVVRIIGVLYRSPVTSIIGDEGNGYYSIAYNIYAMVLLIASYSIPMAVSKVVSGKLALKQYRDAHKVFHCALIYVLIVGGAACLFTYFCAPFLVPASQAKAVPALRILAPAIFISGFLGVLRGYFQAHSTMVPTSVSQIVEQVANAVVSIGAAVLFIALFAGGQADQVPVFGSMGSAMGIVAGVAAGLIFMVVIYRRNRRYFYHRVERDISGADSSYKEIFKVIILMITPVILSTFVYNISATIDQTIFMYFMNLRHMVSETAASLFGVFSGKYWVLINVPVALANSMSTAMIPAVSSFFTLKKHKECNAQVKQAIHFTMLISIPCAVGLGVLAHPIMEVLFPQKETLELAVHLLQIGCISVVFYSLSTISNGVLQGIGKVTIPLRNAAIALGLHILFLVLILYFTGMELIALVFATILYSLLMCIFNSLSVRKYLGYRQEIRKTFVMPAISALIMGVFCYFFYKGLEWIFLAAFGALVPARVLVLLALLIAILFGVVVYFILEIRLRGVNEEDLSSFPRGHQIVGVAKRFRLL